MLDEKDLQAIGQLIDARLNTQLAPIKEELGQMKEDLGQMKEDISDLQTTVIGMKEDISDLRTTVTGMKEDISDLQTTVTGMKEDISDLQTTVTGMKEDISDLRTTVTRVAVTQENIVLPQLKLLAEGHETLLNTLARKDRVEALEADVSLLKTALQAMSLQIAELQKAQ